MILDDRTATAVTNVEHLAGVVRDVAQKICGGDGEINETNPTNQRDARTICVGAAVMLVATNFVIEKIIMNGSMSTVVDIHYKNKEGPFQPYIDGHLIMDVLVDFPNSKYWGPVKQGSEG